MRLRLRSRHRHEEADPGWKLVDALPSDLVQQLRTLAEQVVPADIGSYYSMNVHAPRGQAQEVHERIAALVAPRLAELVPDHEIFLAVFIAKGASTDAPVGFHQDWTFTDERRHRATLCWMPLVDTDDQAGAMRVVAGSHRWTSGLRPSGEALPTDPFPEDLQADLGRRATTVPMRAGQALVYDPALIHGSWPNAAARTRAAVAVALRPTDADLVHFHRRGDGEVVGRAIEGSHFTSAPFGSEPHGSSVDAWADLVTIDEIRRAARRRR